MARGGPLVVAGVWVAGVWVAAVWFVATFAAGHARAQLLAEHLPERRAPSAGVGGGAMVVSPPVASQAVASQAVASQAPAPPVEPPDASTLDARCAQGADALWRGRVVEAEGLARAALRELPASPPSARGRHARARCEALLGRAILARGSRDARVHAEAAESLRRAWALAPSADLVGDLIASHWLGGSPALPPLGRSTRADAAAQRAAARVVSGEGRALSTLRSVTVAGGTTWSLVLARGARGAQLVAVGCRGRACRAELLADTARERVRVASFGFVPSRDGVALAIELDRARGEGGVAWEGTTLHLRWWRPDRLDGWSLLARSRARSWCREAGRRPAVIDVRARFARGRVALRPVGPESTEALARLLGMRDPSSLACDRCWVGGLTPPAAPVAACGVAGG